MSTPVTETDTSADVEVVSVYKAYGEVQAVDGVDLLVRAGEFFTLLGPSGSGKTTTLRLIAGFERPDNGRILLGGLDVTRVPPYARDVNTVFQDYALFPHMSVAANVEYGLRVKKVPREERKRRVAEALEMVRLGTLGSRRPGQLSGGQRQRVALARALIAGARVVVLDDPMSAVDTETERHLVENLRPALAGRTVLIATQRFSTVEVADRAVVLDDGVILEDGEPHELLSRDGPFSRLFGEEVLAA
ncbi:MAG: ABC transporter ATP-binding protein [Gaiellaceae bacterium]